MSYEWVNKYIGTPYETNGRGPNAFDCYGLVIDIYREQLGVTLPDWTVSDASAREAVKAITEGVSDALINNQATKTDSAEDFNIAVLSRHGFAHHVGVVVNGGVLHTAQVTGACVWESIDNFVATAKGKLSFYTWHK